MAELATLPWSRIGGASQGEDCPLTAWQRLTALHRVILSAPNKGAACDILARELPEKSRRWYGRNYHRLMEMSPLDFAAEIGDHRHHGEPLSPEGRRAALRGGRVG